MSTISWRAPLRVPLFRTYFVGRLTSSLGSTVAPIALAFAVLELSGSATDLGLVLTANVVPQVVLLVVGGVIADRLHRDWIVVIANLVCGGSQVAIAVLLMSGTAMVWQLVWLTGLIGTANAFLGPALQGIVPQILPGDLLYQANAVLRLALNIVRVAGPTVGGFAVAFIGPEWVILWDGITFFAAAGIFAMLRLPRAGRKSSRFLADLRHGWSAFWSRTWLWAIVLQYSVVNMVWMGGFQLLGPVIADRALGGAVSWGLVSGGLAVGLVSGAVVAVWWQPRRPLLAGTLATLTKTLPLVALADSWPVPVLVASAVVAGIGVEIFVVCFTTVMQQRVEGEVLSRVSAYDLLFSMGMVPLGYALAGPLADLLGVTTMLLICVLVVTGATIAVLLSRDVRTFTRSAGAGEGKDGSSVGAADKS